MAIEVTQGQKRPGHENLQTFVTLSGPFFERDPGKTLYANIGDMLEKLADEMESDVRADIDANRGAIPGWTGYTAEHVEGYVTSRKTGKRWALWAAVGLPTTGMSRSQAIRTKAAGASIERRFHPFRRETRAIYHARAVLSADLAKGME